MMNGDNNKNLIYKKRKSIFSFFHGDRSHRSRSGNEDSFLPSNIALTPLLKERFASLLTRLQRITQKRRLILQISSARPNEGSTTICYLSGRTMASSNLGDFLIIDCDIYHPDLHTLAKADLSPGLLDLFRGTHKISDVIKPTGVDHLYILPLGETIQVNQAQIMISQNIGPLLEELRNSYDCILIDSPPINLSSLTEIIGSYIDGTIMVIKANYTRREVIQAAINILDQAGVPISGLILNERQYVIPEYVYQRLK
jgi:capsular exopolysaccharide synthesis family protein